MSITGTYKYIAGRVVRVSDRVPSISRPSDSVRQDKRHLDRYGIKDLISIDQAKSEGLLADSYESPYGDNGGL